MAIPGVYELTLPVLEKLADGKVHSTRQITTALAANLGVSERDLERTRPDGRPLFQNRIEWARTHLKRVGLLEYPEPSASRITSKGKQLLSCDPRQLGRDFFEQAVQPGLSSSSVQENGCATSLERELRDLTGPAVADDRAWGIVRRLNGWGHEPPMTYRAVAREVGLEEARVLALGRSCRRKSYPDRAPMLDAALRIALQRPTEDPDELALTLANLGITEGAFCIAGLCEAARRFGRFEEWRGLLAQLAAYRSHTTRPRPFDSWFEIDVFLYVSGLGHRVQPQKRVGPYRVDLLLPDFMPKVVIECDGDRYHGRDRTEKDEKREKDLGQAGYRLIRFKYSTFRDKPSSIKDGLAEILSSPEMNGVQLRAG